MLLLISPNPFRLWLNLCHPHASGEKLLPVSQTAGQRGAQQGVRREYTEGLSLLLLLTLALAAALVQQLRVQQLEGGGAQRRGPDGHSGGVQVQGLVPIVCGAGQSGEGESNEYQDQQTHKQSKGEVLTWGSPSG